ncbi:HD-GYP domain-containing protein [Streptomyces sp. NPDC058874]|uniref:HD-GYP domain-containing protein n=1 Tax=unclassified Streptomyces TaxID=2593676 RepID=UPI0036967FA1
MRDLPAAARGLVICAVLAALACTVPALTDSAPWPAAALLATLCLGCELVRLCPLPGGRVPEAIGSFLPGVLAAVFLLPPAVAALVALPGGLAATVVQRPVAVRRVWHGAQQSIGAWAAGQVFGLLGGPAALGAAPSAASGQPGWPADLPSALLPATASATALCLVVTVLDGAILAAAERRPPAATSLHGLVAGSLAPYGVHGLAGLMMAVMWRSPYGVPAALLVLLPMYVSCWVSAQYHRERSAHQATIRALVRAVDIKDRYTRGHSERVGQAATMIARELGMVGDRLEMVRIAGILHDVGKLGVPTRLLRKDGPLTPQERRIIELHPEYGHEMVRGIGFLGEARSAILHHHERVDGTGYPYGLTGEQIPELARVVAVADAFDAMTSTRSYSRARPVPTALAELERCAGAQFDPAMVRALTAAIGRHGWHPVVTSDDDLQVIGSSATGSSAGASAAAATAAAAEPSAPRGRGSPPDPFSAPGSGSGSASGVPGGRRAGTGKNAAEDPSPPARGAR